MMHEVLDSIGNVVVISLGLLFAWTAVAAAGASLVALGVKRRKSDPVAVGAVAIGSTLFVGSWPLVLSPSGLAGIWTPASSGGVSAGPVSGYGLPLVVASIAAFVLVRRYRASQVTVASEVETEVPLVTVDVRAKPAAARSFKVGFIKRKSARVESPAEKVDAASKE